MFGKSTNYKFLVMQCPSTPSGFFNPRPEYSFLLLAVIQPEPMFFFLM